MVTVSLYSTKLESIKDVAVVYLHDYANILYGLHQFKWVGKKQLDL